METMLLTFLFTVHTVNTSFVNAVHFSHKLWSRILWKREQCVKFHFSLSNK